MVVSVSNKTDDEYAVDNGIWGNADQNGNANECDEISEDHVDEDIRPGNLIINAINDGDGICFIESLPIEVLSFIVDFPLTRKSQNHCCYIQQFMCSQHPFQKTSYTTHSEATENKL